MLKAEKQKKDSHFCVHVSKENEAHNAIFNRNATTRQPIENAESLVGECVDANHPTLLGRVLVQWKDQQGNHQEQWLPALQNLPVRKHDRLLLVKPANWDEMIVTGVIDGYAKRSEILRKTAAQIQLERDETIHVTSRDGRELIELFQTDTGPTIRVLQPDAAVEFPGKLKLSADSIELKAGAGPIHINATDDVRINGEMIHLN